MSVNVDIELKGQLMKILAVSDIHSRRFKTPDGAEGSDYLFVAGDLCEGRGFIPKVLEALTIIAIQARELDITRIIISPGNHDEAFEWPMARAEINRHIRTLEIQYQVDILIAIDEVVILDGGVKAFFSPYHHRIGEGNLFPFNYTKEMTRILFDETIPLDTVLLVTHGPPYSILDWSESEMWDPGEKDSIGCLDFLKFLQRKDHMIKTCIFGHVHNCGGMSETINGITYHNVAASKRNRPAQIIYV